MKAITKRRIAIVTAVLLLVGAFFLMRYLSGLKEAPPRSTAPPRARQVSTLTAQNQAIATTLEVQGRLVAFDKIELFSEVTGQAEASSRPFKVGTYFPKGSLLLRLDNDEDRLGLQAAKSTLLNAIAQVMPDLKIDYPESFPQWEQYLQKYDIDKPLQPLPSPRNDREKLFVAARNLQTQYYTIKSQEERLRKFSIYAPFGGVLTEVAVQPGAIVRAGQKLGSFMATGNYELVATVPLSDLRYIRTGSKVTLTSEDIDGSWTGTVKRISDQIDPGSQTVQVFVQVSGSNLREGMYLRGEVDSRTVADAMRIDRSLLIDEDKVYAVADTILRLLPVTVVKVNRQTAVVRGIPEGTQLLSEPIPGAFDGMKVKMAGASPAADSTRRAEAAANETTISG